MIDLLRWPTRSPLVLGPRDVATITRDSRVSRTPQDAAGFTFRILVHEATELIRDGQQAFKCKTARPKLVSYQRCWNNIARCCVLRYKEDGDANGATKAELVLSAEQRDELERWVRRRSTAQALALRARIILSCAEGGSNKDVANRLGVSRLTIGRWRSRFIRSGVDGFWTSPGLARLARSATRPWRRR